MTAPVYIVLGAGPGLGLSTARRFAEAGHRVVLLGQSVERAQPLADQLVAEGYAADVDAVDLLDEADVRRAVAAAGERHGRIDVLHFNPSAWRERTVLELTVAELLEDVAFGAGALLPALQAAAPVMPAGGRVLVTGSAAADTPWSGAPTLGVQKAAVRNLVTSIDATMKERGVRAVAMQVNGMLAKEGPFGPDAVAAALFAAATRPDEGWTAHVSYNG
ncbi:SDR family NAD(P)-dependent oxidoreductase [Nocardioides jejuensis]|uniref:SDR family oxidoreductase n=1 Tax=Nocardioides jejuensis TaxID=2502782 RepID=A0A4V2NZQ0_9ACTN|nr:SDR family oxidoreductase [Nocardioides jejuensis]TCJ29932.1 SDR family oxidoreductase [Nocardioides jejuensis]